MLKKNHIVRLFLGICLSTITASAFAEKQPEILSTILPIHLITQEIAGKHASAELLIPATQNIHHYTLTPSTLRSIKRADLIIRVSPNMERFLNKTLENEKVLNWMSIEGIHALPARSRHTHGDNQNEHPKDTQAIDSTKLDGHLWFNPENARLLIDEIVKKLSMLDTEHANAYAENAKQLKHKIKQREEHIINILKDDSLSYAVFHDAWQYFQDYFGVAAPQTLNIQEGIPPSAKQVTELRHYLHTEAIACLVASPQSNQALLKALVEGNNTNIVILDPKGAELPDDYQGYAGLLAYTFEQLNSCKGHSHVH